MNLAHIPDGVYEGGYKSFHDSATVRVAVRNHRIEWIEIVKQSPGGNLEEMESLARRIVDSQSLDVDVIGGSSASSKVFLKAVENALTQSL